MPIFTFDPLICVSVCDTVTQATIAGFNTGFNLTVTFGFLLLPIVAVIRLVQRT